MRFSEGKGFFSRSYLGHRLNIETLTCNRDILIRRSGSMCLVGPWLTCWPDHRPSTPRQGEGAEGSRQCWSGTSEDTELSGPVFCTPGIYRFKESCILQTDTYPRRQDGLHAPLRFLACPEAMAMAMSPLFFALVLVFHTKLHTHFKHRSQ